MDISAITNIISNLGFSIACVFALVWLVYVEEENGIFAFKIKDVSKYI